MHMSSCREGEVQGYKRVDGPSEDELKKKQEEGRKNSPFSNPSRVFYLPPVCALEIMHTTAWHAVQYTEAPIGTTQTRGIILVSEQYMGNFWETRRELWGD